MRDLPPSIKAKNITEIAIPGSHNSGTYYLSKDRPVGSDQSKFIQGIGNIPVLGNFVKSMLTLWGVCQHVDIKHQLQIGIRYFDFRVGKVKGQFRIIHGLYGIKIGNILLEIGKFLEQHPEEIVILDFQRLYDCTKQDHRKIIGFIELTFGTKMMVNNRDDITLSSLIKDQIQVIVIFDNYYKIDNPFLFSRSFCPNPWANTMKVPKLFSFLEDQLIERSLNSLFVTQAIVTPQAETITGSAQRGLYQETKRVNRKLPHWIKEKASPLMPNIILTDFVGDTQIPALIISLNQKQP